MSDEGLPGNARTCSGEPGCAHGACLERARRVLEAAGWEIEAHPDSRAAERISR
ncbi:hypothetical protein [Amycolatopsis rubida]|uniref:Uncharacterized protein n=1 Tax=Amycolatopsis rubida TaxID=112413 RepID=A0A1I6B8M2_9PSEU|nr:hypothetical protein [Amycolatopsis rubida]SFQ77298.1 hypothetical protein SAMN05421854_12440 [Amycolatopsis rubida]